MFVNRHTVSKVTELSNTEVEVEETQKSLEIVANNVMAHDIMSRKPPVAASPNPSSYSNSLTASK